MTAKKFAAAAAALTAALTAFSCGNSSSSSAKDESPRSSTFFAMDTVMTLTAYGDGAEEALADSEALVKELEGKLSATDKNSDIRRINSSSGGAVETSPETALLISKALEYADSTGGALNICLYPVLTAWGFTTGEYRVPTDDELEKLLENTDYRRVSVSGSEVSVPEDYMLDLGALAKGYTSDRIVEEMRDAGVKSAIVSLGGNVQALGLKPDGSKWKVAIRDPFEPETDMCVVEVGEKAVITSGNYERYFTADDGTRYWHIIDGFDGRPADNGIVSATIIGDSGLECDALSTATFVMGWPEVKTFMASRPDLEAVFATDEGEIYYTPGLEGSFKALNGREGKAISYD